MGEKRTPKNTIGCVCVCICVEGGGRNPEEK